MRLRGPLLILGLVATLALGWGWHAMHIDDCGISAFDDFGSPVLLNFSVDGQLPESGVVTAEIVRTTGQSQVVFRDDGTVVRVLAPDDIEQFTVDLVDSENYRWTSLSPGAWANRDYDEEAWEPEGNLSPASAGSNSGLSWYTVAAKGSLGWGSEGGADC